MDEITTEEKNVAMASMGAGSIGVAGIAGYAIGNAIANREVGMSVWEMFKTNTDNVIYASVLGVAALLFAAAMIFGREAE